MIRTCLACLAVSAALSFGAAHAQTLNGGGSSLAYPTYSKWFSAYTAANSTQLFSYAAAGSGAGQNAFLNNSIGYFEPKSGSNPNGYASGTLTYGTIVNSQVDFGASDAPLVASQLTNPATGSYAESTADGPLIQIPTLAVAVTIAYNESAQTTTLDLTDAQVCSIFSGAYTNWDQVNSSLPSAPITVVYRSDSSGTTYLLTQHLAAVCGTVNGVTFTAQKVFSSEFSGGVPSNFVGESGSGGVANELLATADSVGYLSPDYTSIAPGTSTQDPNKTTLAVASLYNPTAAAYIAPTWQNTATGLENPGSTSTNLTPPSSLSAAMNPLNWVPLVPTTTAGYTIVGFTTVDLSSCYASGTPSRAAELISFITATATSSYTTIAHQNGFAGLTDITGTSSFARPIYNTFLTNNAGYSTPLNINGTECSSYTGR